MHTYPFRLGTTSYIIPDDILPNARFLADKVQDVELIFFEVDDGPNNLPSPDVIAELSALAEANDLTYTVHLPLDLRLGDEGDEGHISLAKARRVIECTRGLDPWAFVLHLDGRELLSSHPADQGAGERARAWQDGSARALELVAGWAGSPERLAVENLERYPLDFLVPILDRVRVGQCVDVGHLWVDGHDPVPYLRQAVESGGAFSGRTRVIHLHGLHGRDHNSLAHMPAEKLNPVVETLMRENYSGVLTLEVFGEEDFYSSREALAAAWREVSRARRGEADRG